MANVSFICGGVESTARMHGVLMRPGPLRHPCMHPCIEGYMDRCMDPVLQLGVFLYSGHCIVTLPSILPGRRTLHPSRHGSPSLQPLRLPKPSANSVPVALRGRLCCEFHCDPPLLQWDSRMEEDNVTATLVKAMRTSEMSAPTRFAHTWHAW